MVGATLGAGFAAGVLPSHTTDQQTLNSSQAIQTLPEGTVPSSNMSDKSVRKDDQLNMASQSKPPACEPMSIDTVRKNTQFTNTRALLAVLQNLDCMA